MSFTVAARPSPRQAGGSGTLPTVLTVLRVLLGLLFAAVGAVAAVPLLVLVDLSSGGTGLGLCPGGLGSCRASYFTAPELFAILTLGLFVLLAAIAGCLRGTRRLQARRGSTRPRSGPAR